MSKFSVKQIAFSGVSIALAIVIATFIKLPSLPLGGSITLLSMFIITQIGYWYGPRIGICAALAYSVLQYITGPYFIHPLQVLLDFPLAFGALGFSGFFRNQKNGLITGYLAGVGGRFIFASISGMIFYTEYVGNLHDDFVAIMAGVIYNCSYIVPECVITIILLLLPPVSKAVKRIRRIATE